MTKYASMDDRSPRRPSGRRSSSKLDPFKPLIDGWSSDDRAMPREQKRTVRRVVGERGHAGSHRIVQRYVRH